MNFSIKEILENASSYVFACFDKGSLNKEYKVNILYDKVDENTIYLPLKVRINGEIEDHFYFIELAINNGCRAFFYDEERFCEQEYRTLLLRLLKKYEGKIDFVLMSNKTMDALFELSRYARMKKVPSGTKIIAVTGTVGKTTTSQMVYHILSEKHEVYQGEADINIRIRVCQKLLDIQEHHKFVLFELSGQVKGYMAFFSELLCPDYAIITRVTHENLSIYGSLLGIAQNKCSLLTCMCKSSVAILNDCENIRRASRDYGAKRLYIKEDKDIEVVKSDKDGTIFDYKGDRYEIRVVGPYHVNNATKAIELAKTLGYDIATIQNGLKKYESIGDRWVEDFYPNNVSLITDCPNNPSFETMVANIKTFMDFAQKDIPKRIVISEIDTLGSYEAEIYAKLAKFLQTLQIDELICMGQRLRPVISHLKNWAPNIKITEFEAPDYVDENSELVRYLSDTMKTPQAVLMKVVFNRGYNYVANYLKDMLK